MSTGVIIGVVIAIVVLLAVAVVVAQELSRARLRRQFGPEYTRLAKELGSQRKAEAELLARQKSAAKLNIHPLSAAQRTRYASAWTSVQEQFVDNPSESVKTASSLVERVMRDRGYPVGESQQMIAALSVYHARKLDHYRRGEDIRTRSSSMSTEQLREAILSYRELFKDLLDSDGRPPRQLRFVHVLDNVRIPIGR